MYWRGFALYKQLVIQLQPITPTCQATKLRIVKYSLGERLYLVKGFYIVKYYYIGFASAIQKKLPQFTVDYV